MNLKSIVNLNYKRYSKNSFFALSIASIIPSISNADTTAPVSITKDSSLSAPVMGNYESGGGDSDKSAVSGNGRWAFFKSSAKDISADSTGMHQNNSPLYVKDLNATNTQTNTTSVVNRSSWNADQPSSNYDGQIVAYHTANFSSEISVTNRNYGKHIFVAFDATSPSITSDGTKVVFQTNKALVPEDINNVVDVYIADISNVNWATATYTNQVASGITYSLVSRPSGNIGIANSDTAYTDTYAPVKGSYSASISPNGEFVAFLSASTNLDGADSPTNNKIDVFVRNMFTLETVVANVSNSGMRATSSSDQRPSVSDTGIVVFNTSANLLSQGELSSEWSVACDNPNTSVNPDSVLSEYQYIGYEPLGDIYARDILNETTEIVSNVIPPSCGSSSMDGPTYNPKISADGRFVVFESNSLLINPIVTNASTWSFNAFKRDRESGLTSVVNLTPNGLFPSTCTAGTNQHGAIMCTTKNSSMSYDGSTVLFASGWDDLSVTTDNNKASDMYIRRTTSATENALGDLLDNLNFECPPHELSKCNAFQNYGWIYGSQNWGIYLYDWKYQGYGYDNVAISEKFSADDMSTYHSGERYHVLSMREEPTNAIDYSYLPDDTTKAIRRNIGASVSAGDYKISVKSMCKRLYDPMGSESDPSNIAGDCASEYLDVAIVVYCNQSQSTANTQQGFVSPNVTFFVPNYSVMTEKEFDLKLNSSCQTFDIAIWEWNRWDGSNGATSVKSTASTPYRSQIIDDLHLTVVNGNVSWSEAGKTCNATQYGTVCN